MSPPPLPPRLRTPSGHDIPIPESVFGALQAIQHESRAAAGAATAANNATRLEVQEVRLVVATINDRLEKLAASWKDNLVKQIGALALGVLSVIGTVIAARPTLPAPEVRAVKSIVEVRLEHECDPLPVGSQIRDECNRRVLDETQRR